MLDITHDDFNAPVREFATKSSRRSNKNRRDPSRTWGNCKAHFNFSKLVRLNATDARNLVKRASSASNISDAEPEWQRNSDSFARDQQTRRCRPVADVTVGYRCYHCVQLVWDDVQFRQKTLLHREKPFLQTHDYAVHMLFHGYTKQSRCWANCCWSTRGSLSSSWLTWRTNAWRQWIMWKPLMLCIRSPTGVVYYNKRTI